MTEKTDIRVHGQPWTADASPAERLLRRIVDAVRNHPDFKTVVVSGKVIGSVREFREALGFDDTPGPFPEWDIHNDSAGVGYNVNSEGGWEGMHVAETKSDRALAFVPTQGGMSAVLTRSEVERLHHDLGLWLEATA